MALKVGKRLRGDGSACEVVVVRGTDQDGLLECGGMTMQDIAPGTAASGPATGESMIELGKRYADDGSGIELLCTKAGPGPLTFGGRELVLKSAKPLPASD